MSLPLVSTISHSPIGNEAVGLNRTPIENEYPAATVGRITFGEALIPLNW